MSFSKKILLKNICKCLSCGTIIESIHLHHVVKCKCGKIYIDGENSYSRRGGDLNLIHDMSVWATSEELIYSKAESLRDAINKLEEKTLIEIYDKSSNNTFKNY